MLLQILAHTPLWVFALFGLLLWLGIRQWQAHRLSLRRLTVMPVVMAGLSLYGVLSVFGPQSFGAPAWAAAAVLVALVMQARGAPSGARYDAASRSVQLPGSAVPLVLMMGIFFTKYVVGVQTAMHPGLTSDPAFVLGVSLLYGAFSGMFSGRTLQLWTLARRSAPAPTASATPASVA